MLQLSAIELMLCSTWNYCMMKVVSKKCYRNFFHTTVHKLMSAHLSSVYDLNYPCTWILVQTCSCHSRYIYFFLLMNASVCFCLILGLNPGAVPRMGLHPVAPAPFGYCLFLFMLFIYVVYPVKLLKKEKKGC